MAFKLQVVCLLLVASAGFISAKATPATWSMRSAAVACSESDDLITCTKDQFLSFIDNLFQRDSFKVFNDIEVTRNGNADNMVSARSNDLTSKLESFVESRNIKFQVPASDATITYSPNAQGEMNFKVNFGATGRAVEARKSKLKKVFIPIMVFVLLKAITLIPLALGVLGLKAWNALQLSFLSFVTATGLAIFQLCKKLAADNQHPHIAAHGPWEAARAFETSESAQNLAYNAFA